MKTSQAKRQICLLTQENNINDTEQAFADVQIGPNGTAVNFKLDTGSSAKVIPTSVFRRLGIRW